MYHEFYFLKENPFSITSDPSFFFSSSQHSEAFSHLTYGIKERKGIIVIIGEIGTGKTTLCRTVLNHLNEQIKTALILNPKFSDLQLLQSIITDLGIENKYTDKFILVNALNNFLLKETSKGHNIAIIIDEAQNLEIDQLEQIRLLSNLETDKKKLLQIILVGQPELEEKLKLPLLRQLNQRVTIRFHLFPLKKHEIAEYIDHRLRIAMGSENSVHRLCFTDKAIDAIYKYTQGTPRMINILCDRTLLAGYVTKVFTIDDQIIHRCAKEVFNK